MRRHGNLFHLITDRDNLALAYKQARRGKPRLPSIARFDVNRERNLDLIRRSLLDKTFTTSRYHEKIVYEPKKRTIYILPFAPDRIVQHALMNVLIPIWQPMFINDSYACIDGKGVHAGLPDHSVRVPGQAGGTARHLHRQHCPVRPVAEVQRQPSVPGDHQKD